MTKLYFIKYEMPRSEFPTIETLTSLESWTVVSRQWTTGLTPEQQTVLRYHFASSYFPVSPNLEARICNWATIWFYSCKLASRTLICFLLVWVADESSTSYMETRRLIRKEKEIFCMNICAEAGSACIL